MPEPSLKIDHARYVVTLDRERRIVRDGSILVENGRISRVGKAPDLAAARADRVIDARHLLVIPGMMNGHMHISYAHPVRGIFPDEMASPLNHVFSLQAAMTEEEEYHASLLGIVELLKSGTVCFVDPGSTKFPDACLQAYADSGARVISGTCVVDRESDLALPRFETAEALSRTAEFMRAYDGRLEGRLRAWAMPFSPDTCSGELLAGARRVAEENDTWMTVHHVGGTTAELDRIGALGGNVLLSHAPGISDAEVELIAASGASVVMCPSTTLKEGSGLGTRKLPELLARGVAVGLGCDSGNSSNYLDGVRMMNAAALGFKDGRGDVAFVPAEQAVEMATVLGARAVGLEGEIGSLEEGKKADLVVFDTLRAEWRSLLDPVNNLVYCADGRSVRWVVADGRVVLDDGQVTFADERQVAERVQAIGEELLARTGARVNRGRWPIV